jgi:hypothetical protein
MLKVLEIPFVVYQNKVLKIRIIKKLRWNNILLIAAPHKYPCKSNQYWLLNKSLIAAHSD